MRIAIDAMGGDDAPGSIVDGALVAARRLQVGLLLVGDRALIERELARHPGAGALDLEILDTPERIGMSEPATPSWPRSALSPVCPVLPARRWRRSSPQNPPPPCCSIRVRRWSAVRST